jgi:50S ribosomal protein L16 3-hydroxylase
VILQKGDVLYIPPGYPHCGETLSLALSYSIGFRAPSQQELLTELADTLIDSNQGQKRFTSSDEPAQPGLISQTHQKGIMDLLAQLAQDPASYQTMLGKLLSQSRFELDVCEGEEPLTAADLLEAVEQGAIIQRIGGLKVLQLEQDSEPRLFINGDVYVFDDASNEMLQLLANKVRLTPDEANLFTANAAALDVLTGLLNQGLFYLAEDESE